MIVCLSEFIDLTLRGVKFTLYQLYLNKPEKNEGVGSRRKGRGRKEIKGRKEFSEGVFWGQGLQDPEMHK